MLFRRNDGTGDVDCENPDCRAVYTAAEYLDLVRGQSRRERQRRTAQEVAELMRR